MAAPKALRLRSDSRRGAGSPSGGRKLKKLPLRALGPLFYLLAVLASGGRQSSSSLTGSVLTEVRWANGWRSGVSAYRPPGPCRTAGRFGY